MRPSQTSTYIDAWPINKPRGSVAPFLLRLLHLPLSPSVPRRCPVPPCPRCVRPRSFVLVRRSGPRYLSPTWTWGTLCSGAGLAIHHFAVQQPASNFNVHNDVGDPKAASEMLAVCGVEDRNLTAPFPGCYNLGCRAVPRLTIEECTWTSSTPAAIEFNSVFEVIGVDVLAQAVTHRARLRHGRWLFDVSP